MRPPRVSVITFTSYICCIYALKFGQYWTSFCVGNSSVSSTPSIQFLFVRPRFCLRLPSDSASRRTPLPLANSSYCQACSGLSPPSYYTCRAHNIKQYGSSNRAAILLFLNTESYEITDYSITYTVVHRAPQIPHWAARSMYTSTVLPRIADPTSLAMA